MCSVFSVHCAQQVSRFRKQLPHISLKLIVCFVHFAFANDVNRTLMEIFVHCLRLGQIFCSHVHCLVIRWHRLQNVLWLWWFNFISWKISKQSHQFIIPENSPKIWFYRTINTEPFTIFSLGRWQCARCFWYKKKMLLQWRHIFTIKKDLLTTVPTS